tara:strand:- start:2565 stop:2924 length:360 start_codon:yes stop_codon:yes gene_type:complete
MTSYSDDVTFENRTQTRMGIRTRYLGYGKWSVTECRSACDMPTRRIRFRGQFDRVQDGHRAAAQAWIDKHIKDGEGTWRDDAKIVNFGLAFGPDDYFWTWTIGKESTEPLNPEIGGGIA